MKQNYWINLRPVRVTKFGKLIYFWQDSDWLKTDLLDSDWLKTVPFKH
jgi:hypothetical protein